MAWERSYENQTAEAELLVVCRCLLLLLLLDDLSACRTNLHGNGTASVVARLGECTRHVLLVLADFILLQYSGGSHIAAYLLCMLCCLSLHC
jgi:hypothetical protein